MRTLTIQQVEIRRTKAREKYWHDHKKSLASLQVRNRRAWMVQDAWGADKKIEPVTGVHTTINGQVTFDLDDQGTIPLVNKINEIIQRVNEINRLDSY